MKNDITIVYTTNPVKYWSPSTKLLKYTMNQQNLQQLKQSKKVVCCDVDSPDHEYYKAITKMDEINPHDVVIHNTPELHGLKWSMINSMQHIETPFVLFLEHDWEFVVDINWSDVINTMKNNTFVKKISFNKRANETQTVHPLTFKPTDPAVNDSNKHRLGVVRFGCKNDTYMEPEINLQNSNIELTRCLRWSNNPFIARSECYKQWIGSINDNKPGRAARGIEEVMITRYRTDCYNDGWLNGYKKWGVCLYGPVGFQQSVRHTNGKSRGW